jgi:hypothetical protein
MKPYGYQNLGAKCMLYIVCTLNVSNPFYLTIWTKIKFNLKQILSCKIHSCTSPNFLLEFKIAKKHVSMVEWTNLDVIRQFFNVILIIMLILYYTFQIYLSIIILMILTWIFIWCTNSFYKTLNIKKLWTFEGETMESWNLDILFVYGFWNDPLIYVLFY